MSIGRALRHRNYRLFFGGQGISLIGTWLTRFAMGLYTFQLSHSEWQLGLVAFFSQAPTAVIAPVAGVLVDRWDRHRTLVVTQLLAMLQSAALAAFALTHTMTVWHLVVLGAVQAVINAFDMPARQSLVRQLVEDRADLPNAIALNSSLVNIGRLLGPVIATILVALVGIGWCFALDAVSYVAVIGSLLAMRLSPQPARTPSGKHVAREMLDGFNYIRGIPAVRALLVLLAGISTFGGAYTSQLPAVAEQLHGGDHGLGWLMGGGGAGALVGVLYLASRRTTIGLDRLAPRFAIALGAALVTLELAPALWAAVPLMFIASAGLIAMWTTTNTLVQGLVDDDKLGRVMSLYATIFFAGAPVGALLEGVIATAIGPIHTLAIAGVCCIAFATWFLAARRSRQVRFHGGPNSL